MINILLFACMAFTMGMFLPVLFGYTLKTILITRVLCGIAMCVWSIGWFCGGMIATIQHFDVMKIEHVEDGKNLASIKIMLGNATIYSRDLPERKGAE